MPFYYVQDVQQKNQLRTRLEKRPDKINRKVNVASINGAGGGGGVLGNLLAGVLGTLRKFSGSNKHLHWLKIDWNSAKTI